MKLATVSALLLILLGLAWLRGSHSWDADVYTFQKRAGGADQFPQPGSGRQEVPAVTSKNYNYNQQAYPTAYYGQVKTPAKGGATISSSASRVRPGLLQWVKFW
uniref:Dermokine n=2 Tax=Marmota TaxID=9992 RepID=A0A8C5Z0B2_MARMA